MKSPSKTKRQLIVQTPRTMLVSALVMLGVSYVLMVLATDSASTIIWLGFFVSFFWGVYRLIQAISRIITSKKA